ncbi:adenylyl-sulfate kinase [Salinimicrobium marinum]|uniref:Adenylyl-sulfate kinase n=1 Tax=Salinimicrobium marinum TaxID=680283 RepID=A0A918VWK8_9FLAO|nr:adenylyl-sulfate kinase [Salinimicrobium marinum]GHA30104.1 adenylyl-sulfate kinase [Salinimicrobium marinum]
MTENIIKQDYQITRSDRNQQNRHNSFVIWFTGLSGSGKSTIANALEIALFQKNIRTYTLDGDNLRCGLNEGLSFSKEDREENNRRIAQVAKLFIDAGLVTISAFISPLRKEREKAKKIIGKEHFVEIYVNTPLAVCEKRDVKGLYKKARRGEVQNFTGIDSPYEAPEQADLEIITEQETIEESVKKILQFLNKNYLN